MPQLNFIYGGLKIDFEVATFLVRKNDKGKNSANHVEGCANYQISLMKLFISKTITIIDILHISGFL